VAGVWLFLVLLLLSVVAVVLAKVPWIIVLTVAVILYFILLQPIIKRTRRSLGNNDIAFWLISQRMLPPVASIIPIYLLFQNLKMLDTHAALIITYVAVNLPIVVWLMRDYFANIPKELEESARVDGASPYRILWSIVLPLSTPGLVATFLFVLVFAWNEYIVALFLSLAKTQTMPLLVAGQNGTRGPQWGYMSVLIMIMIVPVIAMAIALERYISRGLLVGAVKG
jgi:multiple sugar transport system permease protein